MVVVELDGQPYVALNGGPQFTFDEAVSFQIDCESQDEADYYWYALSKGARRGRAAGSRIGSACPGRWFPGA
jgi:predicted 3-demethylubiquinone-9 3-methyltransferase (glyoxalase superfamily)